MVAIKYQLQQHGAMNEMTRFVPMSAAPRLARTDTLKAIRRAEVGYVRVSRSLPGEVESHARRAAEWLPERREIEVSGGKMAAVGALLDGPPEAAEQAWLRRDLEHWAGRFAALCGGRAFLAGLVEGDARAFAQGPNERLRMVVTYAGSGVEWETTGGRTVQAAPGDVVLFKGKRHTEEAPRRRVPAGPSLLRMAFYFVD